MPLCHDVLYRACNELCGIRDVTDLALLWGIRDKTDLAFTMPCMINLPQMERRNEHSCSLCCGSLCYLCGEKCLKFDAPVLQCQAANCGQRIKKNALYYLTPDSSMLWCQKCYTALPQQIDLSALVGPGGELDPDLDPELDPDLYNGSRGSSSGGGGGGGGGGG